MLNRIIVFFPDNAEKDEYSLRIDAVNLADNIIEKLRGKIGGGMKIGIGRVYGNYEYISESYFESLSALRQLHENGVMHISDLPSGNEKAPGYPLQKEKLLLSKASQGDVEGSLNVLKDIFNWLLQAYQKQPLKMKNKLMEIIILISRIASDDGGDESRTQVFPLEELLAIDDMTELGLWSKKRVESIVSNIKLDHNIKIGSLTLNARKYIDDNFSKPITLEDVAYKVNVSPQYFSRLFKNETGVNFIEYLTDIRINTAKSLLKGTELNIKEIAFRVGYGDPNYFSRIFKKITGLTPTEYKEKSD